LATVRGLDLSPAEQPQPEPEAEADGAETERIAMFVADELGLDGSKALVETGAKRANLLEEIAAGAREELGLEKASADLSVTEDLTAISQKLNGFEPTPKAAASKATATDEQKHLKVLMGSNWSLFLTSCVFFPLAVVMMAIKIGESVGTSDGSAAEFSDLGDALFSLTETQDERDTAKMLYAVCSLVRQHESRLQCWELATDQRCACS